MTVAELIEKLQEFPESSPVFVMGGPDCDMLSDPYPELRITEPTGYQGVYL